MSQRWSAPPSPAPPCASTRRIAICCNGRPPPTPHAPCRSTDSRGAAAGARWRPRRRSRSPPRLRLAVLHPQVLAVAAPLLLLWFGAPGAGALSQPAAAQRRAGAAARRRACSCASWRAAPGRSSRPSSAPPINGCRPTTFRRIRAAHRRAAPRRPTSACCRSRSWPRSTSATAACSPRPCSSRTRFDTLDRLERHRGHFLNWYGTADLVPLEPRYVSTVDSGNLAGCLLTVKQGCLEHLDPSGHFVSALGRLPRYAGRRASRSSRAPSARRTAPHSRRSSSSTHRRVCRADPPDADRVAHRHRAAAGAAYPALDRHMVTLFGDEPRTLDPLALSDLRWSG